MNKQKNNNRRTFHRIILVLVICLVTGIGSNMYGYEVKAATVKLSDSSIKLKIGESKKLKLKNTSKKVLWTSNNSNIAAVGKSTGKVKAKSAGTTIITAALNGKKYSCKVTVRELTVAEKLEKTLKTVKKAYGDNYRPNMRMDSLYLNEVIGLDPSTYDATIGEVPMISAQVDTFIGVHAINGKRNQVETALKTYRNNQIYNTFQYPSNLSKLNASEVIVVGDYVFFIMLGESNDIETNETKLISFYKEQNAIGINAIKEAIN